MVSRVGLLSQRTLRRRLDSNADILAHVHDTSCLAESDILPLCVRVWLHETNDMVGLRIDSE